jgi:hypothetical protein
MVRAGKVMQNTRFPKVWKSKEGLRGFKETIGGATKEEES